MSAQWRGAHLANQQDFPILLKFIFPRDKLSIQVHPGDAYAAAQKQAAGRRGKTEMWHVLSAEPGARVLLGLKPATTREHFLAALAANTLEELFLEYLVHAGDTFFVPAGTPHTISAGMILCEVQQYSDLTYRVYDYGRVDAHGHARELHIEKALDVMNFGVSRGGKVAPIALPGDSVGKTLLVACSYFATERWEFKATVQMPPSPDHFDLLVVLAGSGYFHGREAPLAYHRGECWFLPASLGELSLQPEQKTTILRTYVPEMASLRAELRRAGVSEAQLAQTVFP